MEERRIAPGATRTRAPRSAARTRTTSGSGSAPTSTSVTRAVKPSCTYQRGPGRTGNRAGDPRYLKVINYLETQLADLRGCKGQTCRSWASLVAPPGGV